MAARHARRLFDVADRTSGDLVVAESHFLGDTAAEGNAQIGQQLFARDRKLIAFG